MSSALSLVYDSTSPIESRRAFSPILAGFPWSWDGFVKVPRSLLDFAEELPDHRNFINCLSRYENHLFGFSARSADANVLASLGLRMSFLPNMQREITVSLPIELSVPEYHDLCSLLTSYKYFEVIALRRECISVDPLATSSLLRLPRMKVKAEKTQLHGFEKLADWVGALYAFKTTVERYSQSNQQPEILPGNPFASLVGMLSVNETKGNYHAIENNFIRAAMHIAAMEMIIFPDHVLPDMPCNLHKLGYQPMSCNPSSTLEGMDLPLSTLFSYDFQEELSSSTKGGSPAGLRAPLQLALLLTPLYLTLQMSLFKKSFNRRVLIETAAKLGPCKPLVLRKVEYLFFHALQRLSKGRVLPGRVLKDLVDSIPWNEVDELAHTSERFWFDLQRLSTAANASPLDPLPSSTISSIPEPSSSTTGSKDELALSLTRQAPALRANTIVSTCEPPPSSSQDSHSTLPIPDFSNQPSLPSFSRLYAQPSYKPFVPNVLDLSMAFPYSLPESTALSSFSHPPLITYPAAETQESFVSAGGTTDRLPSVDTPLPDLMNTPRCPTPSYASPVPDDDTFAAATQQGFSTQSPSHSSTILPNDSTYPAAETQESFVPVGGTSDRLPSVSTPSLPDLMNTPRCPTPSYASPVPDDVAFAAATQQGFSTQLLSHSSTILSNDSLFSPNAFADSLAASLNTAFAAYALSTSNNLGSSENTVNPLELNADVAMHDADVDLDFFPDEDSDDLSGSRELHQPGLPDEEPQANALPDAGSINVDVDMREIISDGTLSDCDSSEDSSDGGGAYNGRGSNGQGKAKKKSRTPKQDSTHEEEIVPVLPLKPAGQTPLAVPSATEDHEMGDIVSDGTLSDGDSSEDSSDDGSAYNGRGSNGKGKGKRKSQKPKKDFADAQDGKGKRKKKSVKSKEMIDDEEEDVQPLPLTQDRQSPPDVPSAPQGVTDLTGKNTSGSKENPIDVDSFVPLFEPALALDYVVKEDISLGKKKPRAQIQSDRMYRVYAADGIGYEFSPRFHYEEYHHRLERFLMRAEAFYVKDLPRFRSAPELSCICILPFRVFNAMDTKDIEAIMVDRHIVVTDCPFDRSIQFDEEGLLTLAPLRAQVSLHGPSRHPSVVIPRNEECGPSVVSGLFKEMLSNVGPNGRILNGLDFPMFNGSRELNSFAVDLAAWYAARGLYTTNSSAPYPTEHMRWGLVGHRNTFTFLHIDCDGLCTDNGPCCGSKLWGFLSPRDELPLSSTKFFLDQGFHLNDVTPESKYDFEAIVLRPGDRIYMRPNTPHFVLGLEDSICYGGHYYATCLMQQTLQGMIHAFVLNHYLTNTSHQPSRQLLRRIVFFYHAGLIEGDISPRDRTAKHLPAIDTFDGVMNLLSAAIMVVFGNVLDFRSYSAPNQHFSRTATNEQRYLMKTYDINAIGHNERLAITYTRGVALHIIRWIRAECLIQDSAGVVIQDLPSRYMVQLLSALLDYKKTAMSRKYYGAPHCTVELLNSQVQNVVNCDPQLLKAWIQRPSPPPTSLALPSVSDYSLKWRSGWEARWRGLDIGKPSGLSIFTFYVTHCTLDYFKLGETPFDRIYFAYQSDRINEEAAELASKISVEPISKKRKIAP
ncbi:hypothetical protein CVT26_008086 [Gymnopilus dilepis]|uniref:JmjC domain-containing protein n=1 Tax=Gymnopilus dilepis TaxID=231916 RepID=A0A409YJT6_9AGAR|nr:hypothetical protein CVT26_008086 [Gymnopilus dilepis]